MKKLISLVLTLALGSAMAFSQEVTYLSLIKKSVDSLSVQLQNKEREKSYLIMDIVVKEFGRGALTVQSTFFGKYFNESYADSNPELKRSFDEYKTASRDYENYKSSDRNYIQILNLPSGTADQIKTRNEKLSNLHFKRFRNDSIYMNHVKETNRYVKKYYARVLTHLLDNYKSKNEIFPVSSLNLNQFVNDISEFNPSIYSLNTEISRIQWMVQFLSNYMTGDDPERNLRNLHKARNIDTAKVRAMERVNKIPAQIRNAELKLADLNQKYYNLIIEKYIALRLADSASIPVFSMPLATNDEYINSVDSLRLLRETFKRKNDELTAVLESDKDFLALIKRAQDNKISGEAYKNESAFIINQKFRDNMSYERARLERERSLFRSNLAILRHLVKIYSDEKMYLNYKSILGNELSQIESHPQFYVLKTEITGIKSYISNSWEKYYRLKFGFPVFAISVSEYYDN